MRKQVNNSGWLNKTRPSTQAQSLLPGNRVAALVTALKQHKRKVKSSIEGKRLWVSLKTYTWTRGVSPHVKQYFRKVSNLYNTKNLPAALNNVTTLMQLLHEGRSQNNRFVSSSKKAAQVQQGEHTAWGEADLEATQELCLTAVID